MDDILTDAPERESPLCHQGNDATIVPVYFS